MFFSIETDSQRPRHFRQRMQKDARMPRHIDPRWFIPIGLTVSWPRIPLYSQLDRIVDLRLDVAVLSTAAVLSWSSMSSDCWWH